MTSKPCLPAWLCRAFLFVGLALAATVRAEPPNPLSISECYLVPDMTRPSARATPGLTGGPGSGLWSGSLKLRNHTSDNLFVESAVVHVFDGYGKPLFDIDPKRKLQILCRNEAGIPLRGEYFGGVSVFKFSCDVTVKGKDGQMQLIKLPMIDPATGDPKGGKLPGY